MKTTLLSSAVVMIAALFPDAASAQTNWAEFAAMCRKMGGQPGPGATCTAPDNGANARAVAAAEAEREAARKEQERLGEVAFAKGQAALRKGDVAGALRFYRTALVHAPDNAVYRRQRAATLRAYPGALEQLIGAAADGRNASAAAGDEASGRTSQRSFDIDGTTGVAPPATENVAMVLGRMLDLPLDLREPANADVLKAITQVESMLKYNREVRIRGEGAEDVAKFEKSVADLNATLATRSLPPLPVEKVEAVYRKYQIDVKEKKQ